jgi:zinc protease
MASAGVRASATDSSIVEFMKEIKKYADSGIDPAELSFTRSAIGQADALKYETPEQKAGFIMRILDYQLSDDFTTKQRTLLNGIKADELNALARKRLPYNNMAIVVVGDKELFGERIASLGYEVIDIDAEGRPFSKKVISPK